MFGAAVSPHQVARRTTCTATGSMRWTTLVFSIGVLVAFTSNVTGQERLALGVARVAGPIQSATVVPRPTTEISVDDDPIASAKRLSDALSERLRPVEQRFRDDARLRSAGAIVGLGAIAVGALRGQSALTFVGTQAIRVGVDRQLSAVHAHTGFSVTPAIGRRSFSIVISRTVP